VGLSEPALPHQDPIDAQAAFHIDIINTMPALAGGINSATPEIQAAIYNLLVDLPDFPARLQAIADALSETKLSFDKIRLKINGDRPDVNTLKQELGTTVKGLYDRVDEKVSLFFAAAVVLCDLTQFLAAAGTN
jgi:hypothetical protein